MKDTQPLPLEEFVPESLSRQPRHRPVPGHARTSSRSAVLLLIVLPVAVFILLAVLVLTESPAAGTLLGSLVLVVFCGGGLVVHFLPSLIAVKRSHKNAMAIVALNIFLGWTVIGWVAALVWSCTSQEK